LAVGLVRIITLTGVLTILDETIYCKIENLLFEWNNLTLSKDQQKAKLLFTINSLTVTHAKWTQALKGIRQRTRTVKCSCEYLINNIFMDCFPNKSKDTNWKYFYIFKIKLTNWKFIVQTKWNVESILTLSKYNQIKYKIF
jgi:hypothetical protein